MNKPRLLEFLPSDASSENLLDGFLSWAAAAEIDLYEAQEEAVLEIFRVNT